MKNEKDKNYGHELILDLHGVLPQKCNRLDIELFCKEVVIAIKVQPGDLHFWDDTGVPVEDCETLDHLVGCSANQFIRTSNITIHALMLLRKVFINCFSCDSFDPEIVRKIALKHFGGKIVTQKFINRK